MAEKVFSPFSTASLKQSDKNLEFATHSKVMARLVVMSKIFHIRTTKNH